MRPILPILLIAAACTGGSPAVPADSAATRDTLTRRQRDSIIGQSEIPGARGVAGALRVADSGAAHQTAVDSAANEP